MTMRNRQVVRTPRKDKTWAIRRVNTTAAAADFHIDLLDSYKADLGILETRSLTVMRIVGLVQLVRAGAAASAAFDRFQLGIAWIQKNATPGDMLPLAPGVRETQWIQQGEVEGIEGTSATLLQQGAVATPPEANTWHVETGMQRKQPSPQHELTLVGSPEFSTFEGATMQIRVQLQVMLALP